MSLRRPVPLDTPLQLSRDGDGSIRLLDGDALILEARPAPDFDLDVPAAVAPRQAHDATARYRGAPNGLFRRCSSAAPSATTPSASTPAPWTTAPSWPPHGRRRHGPPTPGRP